MAEVSPWSSLIRRHWDPLSGSDVSEGHLRAVDNRRSVLFVRIRAARALQCVESLRRSGLAEEF